MQDVEIMFSFSPVFAHIFVHNLYAEFSHLFIKLIPYKKRNYYLKLVILVGWVRG